MKIAILLFIQLAGTILFQACDKSFKSDNRVNTGIISITSDIHSFMPDTSINGLLFLNNPASIKNGFGDIMSLLEKEKDYPDLYLLDSTKKEYLRMVLFPGSSRNSISQFEVGYYADLPAATKITTSRFLSFYTESQLKLGISKEQSIQIKESDYKEEKGKNNQIIIRYVLNDFNKSAFLKRYNMPVYFAEYWFKENKLIKYWFGFEYP
ncbi:MAG: hypothetical protein H0W62_14330 [Chitinophagales bacterium]|nr:hypothetical protein [Chitinophagales bacterium]